MATKEELLEQFHVCMPLFIALGDEVRLTIIEALANSSERQMLNVNEVTKKTHLSRPAISHHLKILKNAGLVGIEKKGTSNYYYLTIEKCTDQLMYLGDLLKQRIAANFCP